MTLLIQLPRSLEGNLREAAQRQQVAPEGLAVQILEDAFQKLMDSRRRNR